MSILYLDPSLGAAGGHHAPLARGFAGLLGGEIVFAGARSGAFDAPAGSRFKPAFAYRLEDAFRVSRYGSPWVGKGVLAGVVRTLARLRPRGRALPAAPVSARTLDADGFSSLFRSLHAPSALGALLAEGADAVVCLAADPAMLSALHGQAARFSAPGGPALHLVFMYPEAEFLGPATRPAYFALVREMLAWPRPPLLYAELAEHAAELAAELGAPVRHQILPYRRAALPPPAFDGGALTVAVLGAGRADKAFDDLPAIARAAPPQIAFRIQRPAPGAGLDGPAAALAALSNVTLLAAFLSDAAYEAELARADVVLLAYDPGRYARRGSGVFLDAQVGGRPVVCRAGTALARAMGEAGLAAEGPEGFAAALAQARANYPALAASAARVGSAIRSAIETGPLITALRAAT